MSTYISEEEKLKHPYYKLMELSGEILETELGSWSRLDLIEWLCWNDRNGVYRDEQSLQEFDNIVSKEEAIETHNKKIFFSYKIKKWVPDNQSLNTFSEEIITRQITEA